MGLDMYAFRSRTKAERKFNDRTHRGTMQDERISYWQNRRDLDDWMTQLAFENGFDGSFNGDTVELDIKDLENLAIDIITTELYNDDNETYASHILSDLLFIAQARYWIARGYHVYYTNSW